MTSTGGPYPVGFRSNDDQYNSNNQTYGEGDVAYSPPGSGAGPNVTCSGEITATCTWKPTAANEPPPDSVIVEEDGDAWYGTYPDYSGTCDDGLGDLPVYGSSSGSSSGTRYTVKSNPGASFTLTCSPSSTATTTQDGAYASASVSYKATISPVTINLAGTTPDSSGNLNILVGQHCTASLVGIPSGCTVSNYQWSVTGTTFQTWSSDTPAVGGNSYNPDASYEVDGPGPLTNSTAGWYWNDHAQTAETVSFTATVTPPAGQGSAFTVAVTQKVTVMLPVWQCKGVGGDMQVNTANPPSNGTDYWLHAGPLAGSGETGGMDWRATVSPPSGTTFGAGSLEMVQLVIPNMSYAKDGILGMTEYHTWSLNGQEGWTHFIPIRGL